MRSLPILALLGAVALACGARAQVSNPPALCFGFNDVVVPPAPSTVALSLQGMLVHFVSPTTSAIDQIDLWSANLPGPNYVVDLFATATLGGAPVGAAIGTYVHPNPYGYPPNWEAAPATLAAPLVAGLTYAVQVRAIQSYANVCWTAYYDPAGPQQLPYQITSSPSCVPGIPASGTIGLMVRFRGLSCGPTPPASVVQVGWPCPAWGPIYYAYPQLHSYVPPTLGLASWPVTFTSPGTQPALNIALFWATGTTAGTLFSQCAHYLDPVSLNTLAQAGLEPLAAGIMPPAPATSLTWNFSIPASPAFAGVTIGLQAAFNGTAFFQATNALQVTLGY